jgi:hypothetical protein
MMVTREQSVERPFDVFGPDLELLLEVKPEGKVCCTEVPPSQILITS